MDELDLERLPTSSHWKRIGVKHHHGVCVPLFSLHGKTSCGFGDFFSLIPLIDWCKEIGFDIIQLLPINDTGEELSPYYALSSRALDPIYIHVPELGEDRVLPREQIRTLKRERLFEQFKRGNSSGIEWFVKQNPWLEDYARFKSAEHPDFFIFLQYIAFQQMMTVKRYATEKGVFLGGDFPISVNPVSADVASYPHLFDFRYSAGAPPDVYNREGQNWGSPIFDWDQMRSDHFLWWRERLRVAETCFHLYRIDHVMGLFRIWAIAQGERADQGRYIPQDPALWRRQGEEVLRMLVEHSSMLPMGEDLGVVPDVVRKMLKEFGVCGTKVLRWESLPPEQYDPISLTTVSTPDSEPLQLWWRNNPQEAQQLCQQKGWSYTQPLSVEKRKQILWDAHHSGSLFHVNLLQEYLALFPQLVSSDPERERMNIPGTISNTNWTYRMQPSVEELINHQELAEEMKRMVH